MKPGGRARGFCFGAGMKPGGGPRGLALAVGMNYEPCWGMRGFDLGGAGMGRTDGGGAGVDMEMGLCFFLWRLLALYFLLLFVLLTVLGEGERTVLLGPPSAHQAGQAHGDVILLV